MSDNPSHANAASTGSDPHVNFLNSIFENPIPSSLIGNSSTNATGETP
jgi:hypothetical protein